MLENSENTPSKYIDIDIETKHDGLEHVFHNVYIYMPSFCVEKFTKFQGDRCILPMSVSTCQCQCWKKYERMKPPTIIEAKDVIHQQNLPLQKQLPTFLATVRTLEG